MKKIIARIFLCVLIIIAFMTVLNVIRNKQKSIERNIYKNNEIISKQVELINTNLDLINSNVDKLNSFGKNENDKLNASYLNSYRYKSSREIKSIPNVAHAGGSYLNSTYTNSLEALNKNVSKFKYFELDFSLTSDGHLVCSHDWTEVGRGLALGQKVAETPSLSEFLDIRKTHRWTACTLDEVVAWLKKNDDKYIVTDIKEKNKENLTDIKNKYPEMIDRFIPQIYNIDEYYPVKSLGYKKIIITLYNTSISDVDIVKWIEGKDIYAVTMWHHRTPYLTKKLNDMGYPVYAHTINDKSLVAYLKQYYGIQGIYTDSIQD